MMKKGFDCLIILVILFCSMVYLARNLCERQVHDDEGIYLYSAWRVSEGEIPYRDFFDPQAPLSHLLLGYIFRITGPSLLVARLGSALAMSLATILIYMIGKTILNRICAVVSSALFIFHPLTFSQGRLFMPESFMILFYLAGVYLVVRGIRTKKLTPWFLAGVSFGLGTASKLFGVLSIVGLFIFFIILLLWKGVEVKINLKRVGSVALGFSTAILLILVLLSFHTSNLHYDLIGHHAAKGAPPMGDKIGIFQIFFRESQNSFLGVLSIVCFLWFLMKRRPERLYISLSLILPAFFLLTHTVFVRRHLISIVPFLCLMASGPLAIPGQWKKGVGILTTCIFGIVSFPLYFGPSWSENAWFPQYEVGMGPVIEYIRDKTDAEAYVFCDYPSINFLAQRKLPPRLVDVGSTSTKSGVLDCNEIVYELENVRPAMLLIRSGPPHHISALKKYRRKLNYDRFMTYVEAAYDFKTFLTGEDMTFAVYDRKHGASCNIFPPLEAEFLAGDAGITVIDWGGSQQMSKYWHPALASGDLVYDSCLKFLPGRYVSGFRLKLADTGGYEEIGAAEILSGDNVLIARRALTTEDFLESGVYEYFWLGFTLNEVRELLVRFRVSGQRTLWLDNIVFAFPDVEVDENSLEEDFYGTVIDIPVRVYECEELPHGTGSRKSDKSASDGGVIRYSYGDDAPGALVFGPYERYPGGQYRVTYRLKIDNNLDDEAIMRLDVVSHSPGGEIKIRAERELKSSDFLAKDSYQDFTLNFVNDSYQDRLEFRIQAWGKVDIEADTIAVEPDN